MAWIHPNSSAIHAYQYDPLAQNLAIVFVGGRQAYDFPCTEREFRAFLRAPSMGRFVNERWRPSAR